MLVGRETAMANDYDFQIGKDHLRGGGWRGLVALVITLPFRAPAMVGTLMVSVLWLVQHLYGLSSGIRSQTQKSRQVKLEPPYLVAES
jgi:hypothetical protein